MQGLTNCNGYKLYSFSNKVFLKIKSLKKKIIIINKIKMCSYLLSANIFLQEVQLILRELQFFVVTSLTICILKNKKSWKNQKHEKTKIMIKSKAWKNQETWKNQKAWKNQNHEKIKIMKKSKSWKNPNHEK